MEASTNADAQPPPPASGSHSTEDPQRFCEGLYILTNKQSRTVLDTWGPRSRVGSRCHGHAPTYSESIGNQLWTILQSKGSGKPYTMQNIRYQTFLELARDLENQVIGNPCLQTSEAQSAQEWILVELTPSLYTSGMVCCSAVSSFS
ncbi:hypothetical protein M407DRAFT_33903 [Tulasnella calospora MUT 4182]|uniref:Uncharacterized protein n=1 Tax=Tulasnella calospora MUT 4182 TaxID=1051891 RepID=A0A0C3PPM4_9AGAM|nr:hypothetical protein M407DRAFT_33903 [Tulasnella calospora MUT 4182]